MPGMSHEDRAAIKTRWTDTEYWTLGATQGREDVLALLADAERLRDGISHQGAALLHLGLEDDDAEKVRRIVRDMARLRDGKS